MNDDESGFQRIEAREIDTIGAWQEKIGCGDKARLISFHDAGTAGIIEKIRKTVGDKPVYLSIDVRFLPDSGAEYADWGCHFTKTAY